VIFAISFNVNELPRIRKRRKIKIIFFRNQFFILKDGGVAGAVCTSKEMWARTSNISFVIAVKLVFYICL